MNINFKELCRGSIDIIGMERAENALKKKKKLRIKHGFDATAPDLHLGHSVSYTVLKKFQDLGHVIVLVAGDFTTAIGDPTDRDTTRPELSESVITKNIEKCLSQIGKVLDLSKLEVHRNSEWYNKMSLKDFLKIGRLVTAVRLWERDMFQKRLSDEGTVWTHEFLYPILQGYDSVILDIDLTVIGNDQTFNEMIGRDLQRAYNQEPQGIIPMPILPGTDGVRKMGKSFGNYIGIQESARMQYGKIMSIPDSILFIYFQLLTSLELHELETLQQDLKNQSVNPRDLKMRLARMLVSQFHSKQAAQKAEDEFIAIFQKKELPTKIPTHPVSKNRWELIDLLVEAHIASSKTDARRLVEQKGISLNDIIVSDIHLSVIIPEKGIIIKRGKRTFVRVTLQS